MPLRMGGQRARIVQSETKQTGDHETMNLKEATEAVKTIRQHKTELESLLSGLCGNATTPTPEAIFGSDPYVDLIGKGVYIRQATYHLVGKLASVGPNELVLEGASTVFDTGELGAFLKSGKASAIEPMGRVIVSRGAIVDCCECKV